MKNHMFLCVYRLNQGNVGGSRLLSFESMYEADEYIKNWLACSCGLDCYRGEEEERELRYKNLGELPELSFSCPELKTPSDLERYNGYYCYHSGGTFQLFVMAIHDEISAARFRKETIKEFELDKTLSEEADEMIDMLDVLENSFRENVDYQQALEKIDLLLRNEGLSLF